MYAYVYIYIYIYIYIYLYICIHIPYVAYLGKTNVVWKNLKKGKHAITVKVFCTDNQVARRKFKFEIK